MSDKSILQRIGLVEVFAGPVSRDWVGLSLSERVAFALKNGTIDASMHKVAAQREPKVLIDALRLAGVGEIRPPLSEREAAYWQGCQDMALTLLQLSSMQEGDTDDVEGSDDATA